MKSSFRLLASRYDLDRKNKIHVNTCWDTTSTVISIPPVDKSSQIELYRFEIPRSAMAALLRMMTYGVNDKTCWMKTKDRSYEGLSIVKVSRIWWISSWKNMVMTILTFLFFPPRFPLDTKKSLLTFWVVSPSHLKLLVAFRLNRMKVCSGHLERLSACFGIILQQQFHHLICLFERNAILEARKGENLGLMKKESCCCSLQFGRYSIRIEWAYPYDCVTITTFFHSQK